jgi:hypothetical protein
MRRVAGITPELYDEIRNYLLSKTAAETFSLLERLKSELVVVNIDEPVDIPEET